MDQIQSSNDQIVESVQTLSATSEEVSARTDEALATSGNSVDQMEIFRKRMNDVEQNVQKLAAYTAE